MTKAAETAQHLNEGALRRMYDEPATLSATERAHYDSCADCQHTLRQVAAIARDSAAVLVDLKQKFGARYPIPAPLPRSVLGSTSPGNAASQGGGGAVDEGGLSFPRGGGGCTRVAPSPPPRCSASH